MKNPDNTPFADANGSNNNNPQGAADANATHTTDTTIVAATMESSAQAEADDPASAETSAPTSAGASATAPTATAPRRRWTKTLIAVPILVALLVACGCAWAWQTRWRSIAVTVNGQHLEISAGMTVQQLMAANSDFNARPGKLLALDGTVLNDNGGDPASFTIDNRQVSPADWNSTRLPGDATVAVASGADVTEGHSTEYETVPRGVSVNVTGGVVQMVQSRGKDGKREVWVGDVSGQRVEKDVVEQPEDAQVVGVSPHPEGRNVIALTFDDGPSQQYTGPILDILKDKGVKATFFDVGTYSLAYPDEEKRMIAEGHEVASHSNTHAYLPGLSRGELRSELSAGLQNMQQASGVNTRMIRAPYGAFTADQWKDAYDLIDYNVIWSVDTKDWELPGAQAIRSAAVSGAYNGAVILMHDGGGNRDEDVAALPGIIDDLKGQGYEFVTISELLQMAGASAAPAEGDGEAGDGGSSASDGAGDGASGDGSASSSAASDSATMAAAATAATARQS